MTTKTIPRQVFVYLRDWEKFTDGRPPKAKRVSLAHGLPSRVWTLFRHEDEMDVPTLPFRPVHRVNAFLEDYVHDWDARIVNPDTGLELNYYSRVMDGPCWLLLEYA